MTLRPFDSAQGDGLRLLAQAGALALLAGAWLLGVAAEAAAGGMWWPGAGAAGAAGLAAGALERRWQPAVLGLACACLFVVGGHRYIDERPVDEPAGIAAYNDGATVRFRALVVDEPEVRGRSQRVRLSAREVLRDGRWRASEGGVLLRSPAFPRFAYGDLLELEGELETPPSLPDFDYRAHLERQGIASLIAYPRIEPVATGQGSATTAALHALRGRLGGALERALPEPQAALARGILLGQRSAIPADLTQAMNASGTSHLVAVSGQNVSIVAALVIAALSWLIGRRQAALVALAVIAGYTVLTGASPSVVRAAIMGGLFVIATLAGRPASAGTSIALAAAVMTGIDPLVVHDVSFQLSFAAIGGLVYLAPGLQRHAAAWLRRWGIETEEGGPGAFVLESSAVTLSAVAATLPLLALHFGRISVVAPLANLPLVPVFPFILVSSGVTALAGVAWEPLGLAAGWLSWMALTYMIELARLFAGLPLASFEVQGIGRGHAAVAYGGLAAAAWWLARRAPAAEEHLGRTVPVRRLVRPAWLLAGGLALAASISWWAVLDQRDGRLTVSILDVGQGDAILLETPDGRHVLVDGGPSGLALAEALGEALPFWERTLDLVVLTHPDEDHLAGLVEALERYEVGRVLASPIERASGAYDEWRERIARGAVPYQEARAGMRVDLGQGAAMTVLGPLEEVLASGEDNDASLVLRVTWDEVSFLLTADLEAAGEAALLRSDAELRSVVLKVGHHGSDTSTTPAFVRAVRPAVAVVSVGADNPFGHPAPAVLRRLDDALVLRTDRDGTVRLVTDGERLWAETER